MATPDYILTSTERVLGDVLPLFRRTPGTVADVAVYARYRKKVDTLLGDTRAAARSTTLVADFAAITSGYRQAASDMAAVIDGLERVVVKVRLFQPVEATRGVLALQRQHELAMTTLLEVLALAEIANAVAIYEPPSYDVALRLRQRLSRLFDAGIERASDRQQTDVLLALREAHASLVRDLIERGRPLARITRYETGIPLPAVVLAHELYQDAGRADELRAENPTDHPAFMPMAGKAHSR